MGRDHLTAEIARVLRPHGIVDTTRVRFRPSVAARSAALTEVDVGFDDGRDLALLLKEPARAAPGRTMPAGKPTIVHDPGREAVIYGRVLSSEHLGTPRFYGLVSIGDRSGLLLERVRGVELYQVGEPKTWSEAARWLGALHARFPAGDASLPSGIGLTRDQAFLTLWRERALEGVPKAEQADVGALLSALGPRMDRLAELPRALLHGEFYPANVLVTEPTEGNPARLCVVDWEMAGYGPGVLDLAALAGAGWSVDERRALVRAYRETAPREQRLASEGEFVELLALARVQLALQWLGWSPGWEPPEDQRFDWRGELRAAAGELEA